MNSANKTNNVANGNGRNGVGRKTARSGSYEPVRAGDLADVADSYGQWRDRGGNGVKPPAFPELAEPVLMALVQAGASGFYVSAVEQYYRAYHEYLRRFPVVDDVVKASVPCSPRELPVQVREVEQPLVDVKPDLRVLQLTPVKDNHPKDYVRANLVEKFGSGGCYLHCIRRGYVSEVFQHIGAWPDLRKLLLELPAEAFIYGGAMYQRVCTLTDGKLHMAMGLHAYSMLDVLAELDSQMALPRWARDLIGTHTFEYGKLGITPDTKIGGFFEPSRTITPVSGLRQNVVEQRKENVDVFVGRSVIPLKEFLLGVPVLSAVRGGDVGFPFVLAGETGRDRFPDHQFEHVFDGETMTGNSELTARLYALADPK